MPVHLEAGPRGGPAEAGAGAARVRYLSWGSQSSTARAAGAAHTPRVSGTDPPEPRYSGTLSSEDTIAPADNVVR